MVEWKGSFIFPPKGSWSSSDLLPMWKSLRGHRWCTTSIIFNPTGLKLYFQSWQFRNRGPWSTEPIEVDANSGVSKLPSRHQWNQVSVHSELSVIADRKCMGDFGKLVTGWFSPGQAYPITSLQIWSIEMKHLKYMELLTQPVWFTHWCSTYHQCVQIRYGSSKDRTNKKDNSSKM